LRSIDIVISVLQGLAVPTIAAAGVLIAWQQKRLADIRLQNDLFDRRFKIFEAARTLIRRTCHQPNIPFEDFQRFALDTADADFFFDRDILMYLEELHHRVGRLPGLFIVIDGKQSGADINAAITEKTETLIWLSGEITGIVARFKPSMELKFHNDRGTPMNFRRGLIRSWVLFAASWAVAIGGGAVLSWYNDPWRAVSQTPVSSEESLSAKWDAPIEAASADGVIHVFPDQTDPATVDRVMKEYAQRSFKVPTYKVTSPDGTTYTAENFGGASENDVLAYVKRNEPLLKAHKGTTLPQDFRLVVLSPSPAASTIQPWYSRPAIYRDLGLILGIPLALLVFGSAVWWVVMGFKSG
jgi:hypothetical protein